jgi:tRNA-Thr(GGU) m(6)t(6)A37 methyltransferase TsaA
MGSPVISFTPIGRIHTPFHQQEGTPIQAALAGEAGGSVEIFPEYAEGLLDIEGFSHVFLLYAFHCMGPGLLVVKPYLDTTEHGIFATRSPKRPNPIGLSVVRLQSRNGNILQVQGVDMLDGTPLLDIKPYVPALDHFSAEKIGWFQNRIVSGTRVTADNRFAPSGS